MQRQSFDPSELKAELERSLGFGLAELVRLDGASSLNYRAVRASDGLTFAVKCSPPERQVLFDRLVRHLDDVKGTKAVKRLFDKTCPATFRGFNVICLSWCPGERRFPDQLTDGQLAAFLDDYLEFSAAMQKSVDNAPLDPVLDWRQKALAQCSGVWGGVLRRMIERELPVESVTYDPKRLKVIHGDFHHGNFLFVDGKVAGFFDLEEFCAGYPADDIVRYFVCAAEHLRWYQLGRLRRTYRLFAQAVRQLPWTKDEWRTAINALLVRKLFFKVDGDGVGFGRLVNLLFRARLYRRLRSLV